MASPPSHSSAKNATSATEPLLGDPGRGNFLSENINSEFDVLIVGAGAAGLLAAIRAHHHGLTPLLIEKTAFLGGTSALSGGSVWIPNNHITLAAGNKDDLPSALAY